MERVLGTIVMRLVGLGLLVAMAVALLAPRRPITPYRTWVVALALVALVLGAGVGALVWGALRRRRPGRLLARHSVVVSVMVSVVGALASVVIALSGTYRYGWDARILTTLVQQIAAHEPLFPYAYEYISRYSNNIPLLLIETQTHRLAQAWGVNPVAVFVLLNGLCLALTIQSVYAVVRVVRGPAVAVAAQVVAFALVGLSPWMSVPYTDLLTMPMPIAATALAVTAVRSPSRWRWAGSAVLALLALVVGYLLKTTPAVTLVALLAVAVVAAVTRPRPARALAAVALAAAVSVAALAGATALVQGPGLAATGLDTSRVDVSRTPPLEWWVAMGATETLHQTVNFGGYDARIVAETRFLDRQQTRDYSTALLERLARQRGLSGTVVFYANKAAWNWGDGMFWAYGEGGDVRAAVTAREPLTAWVSSWNNPHGDGYRVRAELAQALWLAVLGVAGLGLLVRRYRWEHALLALSVLGIALFTLVFQGRSRYLLVYVPVVVALAGAVAPGAVHGLWGRVRHPRRATA